MCLDLLLFFKLCMCFYFILLCMCLDLLLFYVFGSSVLLYTCSDLPF